MQGLEMMLGIGAGVVQTNFIQSNLGDFTIIKIHKNGLSDTISTDGFTVIFESVRLYFIATVQKAMHFNFA